MILGSTPTITSRHVFCVVSAIFGHIIFIQLPCIIFLFVCVSLSVTTQLASYLLIWVSHNVGLLFVPLVVEMLSTNKAIGHSTEQTHHMNQRSSFPMSCYFVQEKCHYIRMWRNQKTETHQPKPWWMGGRFNFVTNLIGHMLSLPYYMIQLLPSQLAT